MGLQEKITKRAKEIYKERYGKRNPDTLSSQEHEQVTHEAAVQVQEEIKERQGK